MEMNVKSQHYLEAGQKLINMKFFTPSIHCLYYSVFQMMKYSLAHLKVNPVDYERQEFLQEQNQKASHTWIFNEIYPRFNGRDKANFYADFKFLKDCRIEADYELRFFTEEESVECRAIADRLLYKLNKLTR